LQSQEALMERASVLFNLGSLLRRMGKFRDAENSLMECIHVCQVLNAAFTLGFACGQLGNIALQRGDLAQAERWYNESMKVWEKHGELEGKAHTTYYQLSRLYLAVGNYAAAKEVLEKSLAIKDRIGEKRKGRADCLAALGLSELHLD